MFWLACSFAKVVLSGMPLGMLWTTFYRSWVTRPGHFLSKFLFACSFAKLVLSRHAFEDGLDEFLQVLGDRPGHVLSMFWLACSFAVLLQAKQSMDACDAASGDDADGHGCADDCSRPCCSGPQDPLAADGAAPKRADAGVGCVDSLAIEWLHCGSVGERSP